MLSFKLITIVSCLSLVENLIHLYLQLDLIRGLLYLVSVRLSRDLRLECPLVGVKELGPLNQVSSER